MSEVEAIYAESLALVPNPGFAGEEGSYAAEGAKGWCPYDARRLAMRDRMRARGGRVGAELRAWLGGALDVECVRVGGAL